MSLFSVNFDIFVCFKESRSPCLHHVWWSYRHISSFAESIPTENWIHWNPALKPSSSPPRALHFRSPASSRISCCNSSWHGHRWILLKCWFWVHCSICGKLYGTRCPVRPLPPWNHPQTCLFKEFRPSERTICSAISAFRRSNSCEERSSRLKPRLQLGTIVEDDAVSQWDISSDQTCADPYH